MLQTSLRLSMLRMASARAVWKQDRQTPVKQDDGQSCASARSTCRVEMKDRVPGLNPTKIEICEENW
jgi:hypothetical protein